MPSFGAPLAARSKASLASGRLASFSSWGTPTLVILGIGIFFRLFHFFDNRSLWNDEIFLSSSFLHLGFWELATGPLDHQQKAPFGFLWAVKLTVLLFGKGEMTLRLFPLLCGLASLFAFVPVARYFLKPTGALLALAIMALSPPLIFHTVEIKQYGTELLASVLGLLLFVRYHCQTGLPSRLLWGVLGGLLTWFSYSTLFVLAGIGAALSLSYLAQREWKSLFSLAVPFSLWAGAFAVSYFLLSYEYPDGEWRMIYFREKGSFMPLMPTSWADLRWFLRKAITLQHLPLGLSWFDFKALGEGQRAFWRMSLLPLLGMVIGTVLFFRRSRMLGMVLTLPVLFTLLASAFELYPVLERLIVFWAPMLALLVAKGGERAMALFPAQNRLWYAPPALLLVGALGNSVYQAINPHQFADWKKSYQRESLFYVNERLQEGDVVYMYHNNLPFYAFYKKLYNLKFEAIPGSDGRFVSKNRAEYFEKLRPDFAAFAGKKRVWLVYSRLSWVKMGDIPGRPVWYLKEIANTSALPTEFSKLGKQIDHYHTLDMEVFLFDLAAK